MAVFGAGSSRPAPGLGQLVGRSQHGDPVPDRDGVVASGTRNGVRTVGRDDGDGGQGTEQGPERCEPVHLDLGRLEAGTGQIDLERVATQARLHNGGSGQGGHVENGARPGDLGHSRAHGGIGQLDDDTDLRSDLTDEEGGLEGLDLGALGTDNGPGGRQSRFLEDGGDPGTAHHDGHVPGLDDPDQPGLGVVVDHHHSHTGLAELFDGSQPDALKAAHNDVAGPAPNGDPVHPGIVSYQRFRPVAPVFPADAGRQVTPVVEATLAGRGCPAPCRPRRASPP